MATAEAGSGGPMGGRFDVTDRAGGGTTKRTVTLGAVALVGLCASNARAQSVSISNSTSPSSGQIQVRGSFSFPSGYSLNGIRLFAQPTRKSGGEGGQAWVTVTFNKGSTTSGKKSGTVAVPPGSTYDVQALITITDGSGNVFYYYSAMCTGTRVP